MARSKSNPSDKKNASSNTSSTKDNSRATRETIESIAVAIILAFLFRAFVAEAFVIPTGSMAPTLQGRHMDVECEKCSFRYRTGASVENDNDNRRQVFETTCPICRFPMELDKENNPNQRSFNGDRILVSKFAYELGDPKRWDVIVFKYPGNAKQNYIKRLVGLPDETLWVLHGDVYRRPAPDKDPESKGFRILRKPPHKQLAMLQIVDDTDYPAQELVDAGWPDRWQDWANPSNPGWRKAPDSKGFETVGVGEEISWLRYRHIVPGDDDWKQLAKGLRPARLEQGELTGQLITDFYAYNHGEEQSFVRDDSRIARASRLKSLGLHWVGDLAIECDVEVRGDQGQMILDLVEGGVHYSCRIDVETGLATLSNDGGRGSFTADDGTPVEHPQGSTSLRGAGSYELRFANCDDQLLLWVDGDLVAFDGPTTYYPDPNLNPFWTKEDAGDAEPAGIGAEGVALGIGHLRVLRDVYYVATSYQERSNDDDYVEFYGPNRLDYIQGILADPQSWATTSLFDDRRETVRFELGPDAFFPLGDNSPQSRDARLWSQYNGLGPPQPEPYVRRDLLIGKALLIYWPHAWRRPIPFWPNFRRMGLIR